MCYQCVVSPLGLGLSWFKALWSHHCRLQREAKLQICRALLRAHQFSLFTDRAPRQPSQTDVTLLKGLLGVGSCLGVLGRGWAAGSIRVTSVLTVQVLLKLEAIKYPNTTSQQGCIMGAEPWSAVCSCSVPRKLCLGRWEGPIPVPALGLLLSNWPFEVALQFTALPYLICLRGDSRTTDAQPIPADPCCWFQGVQATHLLCCCGQGLSWAWDSEKRSFSGTGLWGGLTRRGRPWNLIVLDLNPATSQAEGSWQAYQHHATGQRAGESSALEMLHHQGEAAREGQGSQRSLKACSLSGSPMYSMRSLFQATLTLSVCFLFMKTGLIIVHITKKCCGA